MKTKITSAFIFLLILVSANVFGQLNTDHRAIKRKKIKTVYVIDDVDTTTYKKYSYDRQGRLVRIDSYMDESLTTTTYDSIGDLTGIYEKKVRWSDDTSYGQIKNNIVSYDSIQKYTATYFPHKNKVTGQYGFCEGCACDFRTDFQKDSVLYLISGDTEFFVSAAEKEKSFTIKSKDDLIPHSIISRQYKIMNGDTFYGECEIISYNKKGEDIAHYEVRSSLDGEKIQWKNHVILPLDSGVDTQIILTEKAKCRYRINGRLRSKIFYDHNGRKEFTWHYSMLNHHKAWFKKTYNLPKPKKKNHQHLKIEYYN